MIQLVPHLKVLVAYEPVDFRKGIDSLAGLCRQQFAQDPFSGALFVFRNRAAMALKLLVLPAARRPGRAVAGDQLRAASVCL